MRTLNLFLLFFFLFALNSYSLPECNPNSKIWNNCYGTFTSANGNKFAGEYKDDKKHGQGTYTWAEGDKYVGEYKDDKKHGQGTYTFQDGRRYEGPWVEGEFKGEKVEGISSDTMEGLSDAYLMYNLYDQYCGEYVSSSKLKKALKRFIKVALDIERKKGVKFNEKGVKDMAFQQALNKAKDGDNPINFQLRLSYTGIISKLGESAACKKLRALYINQYNEFSSLLEQAVKLYQS
jgi:hypothetical protein